MRAAVLAVSLALLLTSPALGLVVEEGGFGSGARPGGFADPTSVAVDDAGRVYVADRGAGHVEVFESATAGNRPLATIGEGVLQEPVSVAVDNRQRVYVADAGRDVIEVYGPAIERFAPVGTLSGPGQSLGKLDDPWALTTDISQRLYVAERGNRRVSVFRPARQRTIVFQTAFGIALPEPAPDPSAIARDADGRLYIADVGGAVRAYDRRGRFISRVGSTSPVAPRGVAVDRFNRVAIADTGRDRIVLHEPLVRGAPLAEIFGGPGDPVLQGPRGVAFAPGALLYVLEAKRVVRLRFDDADLDGVADRGDNCLALANGDQADTDADEKGDACDGDDDADGRPDDRDRCPVEVGGVDGDGDGCRDPTSRFLVPQHNRRLPASPVRLTGRADAGALGVGFVEVALARRSGAACTWLTVARTFSAGPCDQPVWLRVSGKGSWRVRLRPGLLSPGRYSVFSRAHQTGGLVEARFVAGRNLRSFSVTG